jgi:hypothetical protein
VASSSRVEKTAPIASYFATDYVVLDGAREIVVRIGESNPELDALLDAHDAGHGIFITAHNPRSERQTDAINVAASEQMRAILAGRGLAALPHIGRSPDGDWIEHGFFVLSLDPADALTLAAEFDQFAIVVASKGAPAELLLTCVGSPAA